MSNAQDAGQTPGVGGVEPLDEFEAAFYEFAGVKAPEAEGNGGQGEAEEDAAAVKAAAVTEVEPADDEAASAPAPAPAAPDPAPAAAAPAPASTTPAALSDEELLKLVPADQVEALRSRLVAGAEAQHRLASESGRQAALQRLLAEQRAESDRLRRELSAAKTPAEKQEAQAAVDAAAAAETNTQDKISEEFPELSDPLNIRIREEVKKLMPPPPDQPAAKPAPVEAPAPASQPEDIDPNVRYAAEYAELFKAYPNWQADRMTKVYEDWIAGQPAGVQALGDSENVGDAKFLLGLFYRAKAEAEANVRKPEDKRDQLREHVAPRRNPGPRTEGGAASDSFESHFDGFAAARQRR